MLSKMKSKEFKMNCKLIWILNEFENELLKMKFEESVEKN